MPTYEYRCPSGHDFEHFFRKISDRQATLPCPVCGAAAERRVSGGAGLVFKGSGFYITDYGKDGKKDLRAGTKATSEGGPAPQETPAGAGDMGGVKDVPEKSATPAGESGAVGGTAGGPPAPSSGDAATPKPSKAAGRKPGTKKQE